MDDKTTRLKRKRITMPAFVEQALNEKRLMNDFKQRPDYQQNDYLAWILRAKKPQTQIKRIDQMLHELDVGGVYMKMAHPPSAKS